jgi:hypothetical protein
MAVGGLKPRSLLPALALAPAVALGACAAAGTNPTHVAIQPLHSQADKHRPGRPAHRPPARRVRLARACPAASHVLDGVYHPDRLMVLSPCRRETGLVATIRHEQDGDLHIDVQLDGRYRRLLRPANFSEQHGDLVVEFMARDGGHLPAPSIGERIALLGAWVADTQHQGWAEIHPAFEEVLNGGAAHLSGPQYGGSPPSDRSSNAAEDCRTLAGLRCRGYRGSTDGSSGGADKNCSDFSSQQQAQEWFDSHGGSPTNDVDGLDRDHDGRACESLP